MGGQVQVGCREAWHTHPFYVKYQIINYYKPLLRLQLCKVENCAIHSAVLGLPETPLAFRKAQLISPPRERGFCALIEVRTLSVYSAKLLSGVGIKMLEPVYKFSVNGSKIILK